MDVDTKLNTLAAIVRDDVVVVTAEGFSSGKRYVYLAPIHIAEQLQEHDVVLAERDNAVGMMIIKVISWTPEVNLDPENGIHYRWIFGKVDRTELEKQLEIQEKIVERLRNRRQQSVREQALAALGISDPKLFLENIKAE